MGVFKNEVGRPSNETIRKRSAIKAICIVLVLIIIGMGIYILNDKGIITINISKESKTKNKSETKSTQKQTTKKELAKEENLSDEEGRKIAKSVFGNFTMFWAIDSKKLELNNDNMKTYTAIINMAEGTKKYTCKELFEDNIKDYSNSYGKGSWQVDGYLCSDGEQTLYDYSEVNNQYKKMFGEDKDALASSIDIIGGGKYGYSKLKNGYSFLSCECGGAMPAMISGFTNVKKQGTTLLVDYLEIVEDDNQNFVFNDGTKISAFYTNESEEEFKKYGEEQFQKYKDKINTKFTLVFEEQKDGNYIFKEAR